MTLSDIFYTCMDHRSLEGYADSPDSIDADARKVLEANGVDVDGIIQEISEIE